MVWREYLRYGAGDKWRISESDLAARWQGGSSIREDGTQAELPASCIYFYDTDFNRTDLTFVDLSGHYLAPLPPGQYYIWFRDCAQQPTHDPEFFNNSRTWEDADLVPVGGPGTTRGGTGASLRVAIPGDGSCDSHIDSVDAAMDLQFEAQLASPRCLLSADANGDGDIGVIDATLILQYSAGLLGQLPP